MGLTEATKEYNQYLDGFTDYVEILRQRSDKSKLQVLSEMRGISVKQLEEEGVFYIGNMAEMLVPDYLNQLQKFGVISNTNHKPIFHERWVFPIRTVDGRVINLVGYSKEANERYVYGTGAYYRRNEVMYGLENMELAYELGYAIYVEGITDAVSIRDLGYKNCFAACGTRASEIKMKMFNRCKHGIIRIHDRDSAGDLTRRHWKTNRYVTLNIPLIYKDADETLHPRDINGNIDREKSAENIEWFRGYIDSCIEWLLQKEHRGHQCATIEATMM